MPDKKPIQIDLEGILADLKDFQRQTVNYVFKRMFTDANATSRFLVADEVGLGKTLVARGIIAKTIHHLRHRPRVDIIYICSNSEIARQNIGTLNVMGSKSEPFPTRLTLLPKYLRNLKKEGVNFISFTPKTAFEMHGNLGQSEERVILYHMLPKTWLLETKGAINTLRGLSSRSSFADQLRQPIQIEPELYSRFLQTVESRADLRENFKSLAHQLIHADYSIPEGLRSQRNVMIGELRNLLAHTCIHALEPDLIILDEFQRFRHLLQQEDENDVNELAQALFNYQDQHGQTRVLLLSATPYKMYTLSDDVHGDNHYSDFLHTLNFLQPDPTVQNQFSRLIHDYRTRLLTLGKGQNSIEGLVSTKEALQSALLRTMVRTERLAATADRNGMLEEHPSAAVLQTGDVSQYLFLHKTAELLDQPEVVEYWKSSPYLLNFMEGYQLKHTFDAAQKVRGKNRQLAQLLSTCPEVLFPWQAFERYDPVDPANARLRILLKDTVDAGAWRLLWIPPSLPYYQLEGAYADPTLGTFTKRIVFSSWTIVPKVIATLISYAAERNMILSNESAAFNSESDRERRGNLLRFAVDKGRPASMSLMTILYPCTTLAQLCDPLAIAATLKPNSIPSLDEILMETERRIREQLAHLSPARKEGAFPGGDPNWYWAAPVLLDLAFYEQQTRSWADDGHLRETLFLPAAWSGENNNPSPESGESSNWSTHVEAIWEVVDGKIALGPQPDDLARILALQAVASPAIAALRALGRVSKSEVSAPLVRLYAGQIAWAMRSLFNQPEKASLVRGLRKQVPKSSYLQRLFTEEISQEPPYWQLVLRYCAEGGLQAVLDEYVHLLADKNQLAHYDEYDFLGGITEVIRQTIMLRTVHLRADQLDISLQKMPPKDIRANFALRFGNEKDETNTITTRSEQVRAAFNSPFYPFVLATTSIGQEGLDFHHYCHIVVHWNLPSNPVDLEQREGRIHRYKGHVIRKNLAERFGLSPAFDLNLADIWAALFELGRRNRRETTSDIEPYWVLQGKFKIERHVPILPFSRDSERLVALKRSLVVYRMVFGQPRQEDLIDYLLNYLGQNEMENVLKQIRIDLNPPNHDANVA